MNSSPSALNEKARQDGQQDGEMGFGGPADLRPWWLHDDPTVEHMGEQHEQCGERDGGEEPVDGERDERQPEHVEADVLAELGVGDAE